ncbi:MAG: MBL fold metallo-hydrolase, partial [Acetobacteraceae bacterium]
MLDFGATPDVLLNNFRLLKIDPTTIDGLILSHGHADHFGGLIGFIEHHRSALRPDVALVVGGEDNFCWNHGKAADSTFPDFGVLNRADLQRLSVPWSTAEAPRLIGDQAFSTGRISRAAADADTIRETVRRSSIDRIYERIYNSRPVHEREPA